MELQLPNFVVHQCEEIASCRCQNPIANFGCPPLSPWNQPKKVPKKNDEEWLLYVYIYIPYIYMYIYMWSEGIYLSCFFSGPWTLPWVETWCLTEVVMGSPYPVEHAAPEAWAPWILGIWVRTSYSCELLCESNISVVGNGLSRVLGEKWSMFLNSWNHSTKCIACESNNFFGGQEPGHCQCSLNKLAGDWHLTSAHSNTDHRGSRGSVPVMELQWFFLLNMFGGSQIVVLIHLYFKCAC